MYTKHTHRKAKRKTKNTATLSNDIMKFMWIDKGIRSEIELEITGHLAPDDKRD